MVEGSQRAFPLRERRIVLGVTGGIAAYKAAELCRLLIKAEADVHVVMTRAAQEFVTPLTFQALTGHPVATDLFDLTQESEIGHIRLADEADLLVVAPATADVIARMAAGMAGDLLTTVALATTAPILLAPAMNVNMWQNPLTQDNVRCLVDKISVSIVGPGEGFLACKMTGPGRLAEPQDIVRAAACVLSDKDLDKNRVLITAGPTREAIDPVRFLSNRSSGKMGFALAQAAWLRGADVTLIAGPTQLAIPSFVDAVSVATAAEMHEATLSRAPEQDVIVMSAAVADFRPAEGADNKLKKKDLGEAPSLVLERTTDVLAELGAQRKASASATPLLVGFAAETESIEASARRKLAEKACDLIVANDVSAADAGFATDTNRVIIIGPKDEVVRSGLAQKSEVAHLVWDRVASLLHGHGAQRKA